MRDLETPDNGHEPEAPNRAARRAAGRAGRGGRRVIALGSSAALVATGAAAGVALTAVPAGAATIPVTNTNDSGPGSLRQALADAGDGDVIDLTGISGTIVLVTQLELQDGVTITGPGADVLTISGNGATRVFNNDAAVPDGQTVTITGVTIADGVTGGPGAGIFFNCDNDRDSSLVLDSVVVTGNTAVALGGGLYFDECDTGDFTITNSTVSNNESTDGRGGGIWFDDSDTLSIVNSTVSGNRAAAKGGGLLFDDGETLDVRSSTFSGNEAGGGGGGIYIGEANAGATIANSTIANNTAFYGGGVAVLNGDLTLLESTISGNTATGLQAESLDAPASGLYLGAATSPGSISAGGEPRVDPQSGEPRGDAGAQAVGDVLISGTIVAGNTGGDDVSTYDDVAALTSDHSIFGTITDNITVTDEGGTQLDVADAGLGALGANGGPTQTMALLEGSPAIDAGPDPVPDFPGNEFDQRGTGFARVVFGVVDVGAFEVQAPVEPEPIVIVPTFTG